MQIEVVFRNLTPSDPLKNYALKRFQKIERMVDDAEAKLLATLSMESGRPRVDIQLSGQGVDVVANEKNDDMYAAIDLVNDRIGSQLRKASERRSQISRDTIGAVDAFHAMGKQCKDVSGGMPVFISPWIDGKKAIMGTNKAVNDNAVSVEQHEKEWNQIFAGIHDVVDAVAFQDGHIDYDELDAFFSVNKKMADKYGMQCWTNAETFDRDMPIKFLPIKFDKLRLKLEAAKRCGYDKAITFEFPHFLSPQSVYGAAGNLYNRYKEYFNIK